MIANEKIEPISDVLLLLLLFTPFSFYMENSHQSIQFYPRCTVNGSFNHAFFIYEKYVDDDDDQYLGICRLVMDTKYHTLSVEVEFFPSIFLYQIFYKCLSNKHIQFSFDGNRIYL
jgi:hypothetical protein